MAKMRLVRGRDLRVGDTIDVWWGTRRDTIWAMRPITGPLAATTLKDARVASFTQINSGMTILADQMFEVVGRHA